MTRLAGGLYRVLLWALPPPDRRRFGEEMAAAFQHACGHAAQTDGWRGILRATWRAVTDLLLQLPREWLELARISTPGAPTAQSSPSRPAAPARGRQTPLPASSLRLPGNGSTDMFERISRDLRQAVRSLLRSPSYCGVVIATLAVGIGASTAIFSVVHGVLLAPLPYPRPDEIVNIAETAPEIDIPPMWVSTPNWSDYRQEIDGIVDLSLFRGRSMAVSQGDTPFYAYGAFVTADFFSVFGVEPLLGRGFTAEEVGPDPAPVVVLGHGVWQERFGGDERIVGELVQVDGTMRNVVGVMPPGFDAPGEWIAPTLAVELWVPFPLQISPDDRINRSFHAVGRLRQGVTLAQAREQLATVFSRLQAEYPEANGNWKAELHRWHDRIVGDVRGAMNLLWAAVSLVLLVACVNVAGLLFARLLRRRHEISVRRALGASTPSLLQGVVTESVLLALLGGTLGVGVAALALRAMLLFEPGRLPLTHRIGIDGGVLAASFALSITTGLLFGIVPAWLVTRRNVAAAVQDAGGRTVSGGRGALWTAMVAAQVALAFVVTVGAALVGRSFVRLTAVPPGIDADRVMTATVALSWDRVTTLEERSRFIRDVLDRIAQIPGVESAAEINSLPFSGSNSWSAVWLDGQPAADRSQQPVAAFRNVTPAYLETMGIPLQRGRWLTEADMLDTQVAVINQAFADNYWPGVDPLGRTVAVEDGDVVLRIAGIVGDVRHFGLDTEARPEIYLPYTRDWLTSKTFVVRAAGDPASLAPALRDAVAAVDPDQPLRDLRSMSEVIAETTAGPRFNALMMSVAAAIALGLAALGLFGALSYMVAERARELGIRMALGGSPAQVVARVLLQATRLAGMGVLAGLLLALAGSRLVAGLLFDVAAADPVTFGVVAVVFFLAAVMASWLPARRASRVDPLVVLHDR